MLAPVLFVVLAFQADPALDQKVTFNCAAEPVAIAMDQLGKQSGVPLVSETPVSSEMVVLRFNNVPLREAMDKVAKAASAEWVKNDSGYHLERSMELVHAMQHKEKLDRLNAIKAAIKDRIKNLAPFDQQAYRKTFERQLQAAKRASQTLKETGQVPDPPKEPIADPGERLTTRILAGVDLEALADLPHQQRIVFSTNPTAMQRTLGGDLASALSNYVVEQNSWAKAEREAMEQMGQDGVFQDSDIVVTTAATTGTTTGGAGQVISDAGAFRSFGGWGGGGEVTQPIGKVLMVATADWDSETIDIRFKICDRSGKIMITPGGNLSVSQVPETTPDATPDGPDSDPSAQTQKPQINALKLSPLAGELQTLLSSKIGQGQEDGWDGPWGKPQAPQQPMSDNLRQFILHPEEHEPLSLVPSEPILKAAEAKDLNVALCIDDSSLVADMMMQGVNVDQVMSAIQSGMGHVAVDKSWIVGTPQHPLQAQHESRPFLGKFLRTCASLGRAGLDPLGAYAQKIPDYQSSIGSVMNSLLFPDQNDQSEQADWLFVRLFGSLSETQRDVLSKGGKISLLNLDPAQQNTIAAIIYRQEVNENRPEATGDTQEQVQEQLQLSIQRAQEQMMGMGDSLKTEPTELLPNGLTGGVSLTLSETKEQVIFTTMEIGGIDLPPQAMEVDMVAASALGGWDRSQIPTKIKGYHLGDRRTFDMTIGLPSNCYQQGNLIDARMQPGPLLSLDKLPPDLKKQIDDRTAELKKFYDQYRAAGGSWSRGGDGQNGVPPPHP